MAMIIRAGKACVNPHNRYPAWPGRGLPDAGRCARIVSLKDSFAPGGFA
ncbi:MAG: hypothetical protein OXI37_04535 [Gammaproteobacteria bacterium]|nr:hypothetical protein [Gammaproteobacteria bacterium]